MDKPKLINLTLPLNRSRLTQGHHLNKLWWAGVPYVHTKFRWNRPTSSEEIDFWRVFTIYGRGGHLGHVTSITPFSLFPMEKPKLQKVKVNLRSSFEQTMMGWSPDATYQVPWKSVRRFWRRFLKGLYHIWAWRPSWSCDPHAANFVPPTQGGST